MKALFDKLSLRTSKMVTRAYSTSFSLGILMLDKRIHDPIYAIYGFVRFADEIVDTFHDYDKKDLLERFREDTYRAIDEGISLNPILNSFQATVKEYQIERYLIDTFLDSMAMDLEQTEYNQMGYEDYILGSAEVVGLMCLRVFCENNQELYDELKAPAMKLGSAFQKINFLRDIHTDYKELGRVYFPGVDMAAFDDMCKQQIERDIEEDFAAGLEGIKRLPACAKFGVYTAYMYYYTLFEKIRTIPSDRILDQRIRIPNLKKYRLLLGSYVRYNLSQIQ